MSGFLESANIFGKKIHHQPVHHHKHEEHKHHEHRRREYGTRELVGDVVLVSLATSLI